MTNEAENWVTIDEVAEHLKVHKDTIRIWIKKKAFPANKIGKQWRFRLSEVDAWVESGKSADI